MYNKVEVTGVNTSHLKSLTYGEQQKLIAEIKNGNKKARDDFISGNIKLVLSVIQKFGNRGKSPDDIFQVGCIGLIKAVDNFDTSLDVRFSTYAVPMIIGEIRRYLRDNNAIRVSRSVRDLAYKASGIRERYVKDLFREPTSSEIAKELGVTPEEVNEALDAIAEPVSLHEPIGDESDGLCIMDAIKDEVNCDSNWIDEMVLKDTVGMLKEREKRIVALRFFAGKTQTEVAEEIGISQAQVSRLEKNALDKIKNEL